jgi:hypothetical protein
MTSLPLSAVFNDPWSRRSFADLVNARQVVFLVAADVNAVVDMPSCSSPASSRSWRTLLLRA